MLINWAEISSILSTGANVLLYGAPGFGKTHIATVNANAFNVTVTEETAAAELRGHYIPRGPEFVWHNGPALLAWQQGRRLVVNEIDRASGDALTFFYNLLDDPRVACMTLPTGETVRPSAGYHCVATMNATDLESALPAALLDRFAVRIQITELHPDAIASLSADLRGAAVDSVGQDDPDRRISFRQWRAFDSLRQSGRVTPEVAARAVFGMRGTDVLNSLKLAVK
jgi:MoxR-like ATPase